MILIQAASRDDVINVRVRNGFWMLDMYDFVIIYLLSYYISKLI
jgi:hypothetical protein